MTLIWSWRHMSLQVDEESDDVSEWMRWFFALDESDDCAMEGVETGGQWFSREQVHKMPEYCALEAERNKSSAERSKHWQSLSHIEVKHPELERWALVDAVAEDAVRGTLAKWAEIVGPDRVRVRSRL